jgi:hypothetical protein
LAAKEERLRIQHKKTAILVLIVLILIGVRAYLPIAIRNYVNRTLDRLPDYDGQIGDVDLNLWRGAYNIQNCKIVKTDGKVPVPFFESENIDLSVQWKAIFEGKAVGEIEIQKGKLNFVSGPTEQQSQTEIDSEWLSVVKDLFPLRINRFELNDGEVHFKDFHSDPKVDVKLTQLYVEGKNLSNSRHPPKGMVGEIEAHGKVENQAPLNAKVQLEPAAKLPKFNLDMDLRELPVKALNDFLTAYANIDAESGTIGTDIEIATADNRFKGYIKPIIKDLKILSLKKDSDNPFKLVWESFVGFWNFIFENQKHDQIAAKIPFSGTYDHPHMRIWPTVASVLQNAFVQAITPGNDKKIDLKDVTQK